MLIQVTMPLMRVAILVVILVGVVLANVEIGSTLLLHAPAEETLAITLCAIEANSPRSYVAALSLIQLSLLAAIALGVVLLWALDDQSGRVHTGPRTEILR